jgi:hypothetical protein
MPTWEALLVDMADKLVHNSEDKAEIERLIAKEKFLEAAQIVRDTSLEVEFSSFIQNTFGRPKYQASKIHESVYSLDAKIVITPNYDTTYEDYCKRFSTTTSHNVCTHYQSHALNDIRSDMRVILKIHGTVDDPTKIILSRSDYFAARRASAPFYALLDALFLANTILFIGAGLTDPDIQLVLENAHIAFPSTNPHYAVIAEGRHPSELAALRKTNNIHAMQFPAARYDILEASLDELTKEVAAYRGTP